MKMSPLLATGKVPAGTGELKIEFNGEWLPEPVLLSVDIVNIGNVAIEKPPIEIKAHGTTYVIPIYIEDVPPGYEDLWELERTDAESCAIRLEHINPGQIVKARFFLDEIPTQMPMFRCPLKDATVKPLSSEVIGPAAQGIMKILSPQAYAITRLLSK